MRIVTITHACGHVVKYRKRNPVTDLDYRCLAQWRGKQAEWLCNACYADAVRRKPVKRKEENR